MVLAIVRSSGFFFFFVAFSFNSLWIYVLFIQGHFLFSGTGLLFLLLFISYSFNHSHWNCGCMVFVSMKLMKRKYSLCVQKSARTVHSINECWIAMKHSSRKCDTETGKAFALLRLHFTLIASYFLYCVFIFQFCICCCRSCLPGFHPLV